MLQSTQEYQQILEEDVSKIRQAKGAPEQFFSNRQKGSQSTIGPANPPPSQKTPLDKYVVNGRCFPPPWRLTQDYCIALLFLLLSVLHVLRYKDIDRNVNISFSSLPPSLKFFVGSSPAGFLPFISDDTGNRLSRCYERRTITPTTTNTLNCNFNPCQKQ